MFFKLNNLQNEHVDYKVGCFVSPHGYGHAARASAVMSAMHDVNHSIRFEIFTTIPRWFFHESLTGPFVYQSLLTDIGLVQKNPMREDLPETLRKLNDFFPFDQCQIKDLSEQIKRTECQLIICDISPMGIMVAQKAKVPSVLIENFTWDWVYEEYLSSDFPVHQHVDYLGKIFESADFHIQTEPVCNHKNADLTTLPVSRMVKTAPEQIREKLRIPECSKVVMITMGGIPEQYSFLEQLRHQRAIFFIIPGGSESEQINGNLALLPHYSEYFHPDLINTCDAVIGKLGYSTLAEVYSAGVPYGYIPRQNFKESEKIEIFVKKQMNGCSIGESQFYNGSWLSILPALLALPKINRNGQNGAENAAQFICKILSNRYY